MTTPAKTRELPLWFSTSRPGQIGIGWKDRKYTKWTSVETATPAQIRRHLERLIDDRERIDAEITDLKRRAVVMTA
jgi:hypothetical protein